MKKINLFIGLLFTSVGLLFAQSSYFDDLYYYDDMGGFSNKYTITDISTQSSTGIDSDAGGATYFNGMSGRGFEHADELYDLGTSFTFNAWIKPDQTSGMIFSQYECGGACPGTGSPTVIQLHFNGNGDLQLFVRTDENVSKTIIDQTTNFLDGNWHMVTAVIDGVSDKIMLYVDNSLADEASHDITTFGLGSASTRDNDLDPLLIGAREQPGNNGMYESLYTGSIDEFFVFSRVFSTDDVNYFYNRNSSYDEDIETFKKQPIHNISFNDMTSEDHEENTTRIFRKTLSWSTDRNGNSQSSYSPTATALLALEDVKIDISQDFSISLWMNMEDIGTNNESPYVLLSSRFNDSGQEAGGLEILANNDGTLSVIFNGTVNNVTSYNSGAGFITKDTWHHITVTRTGNSYQVFYDGQSVTTGSINPNFPPINNPVWTIGSMLQGGSSIYLTNPSVIRSFNGKIDDIQFFGYELDETEGDVTTLFQTGTITHLFEEEITESFSFYPNPAQDVLFIDSGAEIKIFDLLGNQVLSETSTGSIDISSLTTGHYILQKDGDRVKLLVE